MHSTSVRTDIDTHQQLKALAASMGTSVGDTVALAVRRLRQDQVGAELPAGLRPDEQEWLDADPGGRRRGRTLSRRTVENGLARSSAVQCQHVRSVAAGRLGERSGNVGATSPAEVRDILGLLLDVPG